MIQKKKKIKMSTVKNILYMLKTILVKIFVLNF